jgi:hypothetical protein
LTVSIVEIFNEKVLDLMGDEEKGLKIRENKTLGVFIEGLKKV